MINRVFSLNHLKISPFWFIKIAQERNFFAKNGDSAFLHFSSLAQTIYRTCLHRMFFTAIFFSTQPRSHHSKSQHNLPDKPFSRQPKARQGHFPDSLQKPDTTIFQTNIPTKVHFLLNTVVLYRAIEYEQMTWYALRLNFGHDLAPWSIQAPISLTL